MAQFYPPPPPPRLLARPAVFALVCHTGVRLVLRELRDRPQVEAVKESGASALQCGAIDVKKQNIYCAPAWCLSTIFTRPDDADEVGHTLPVPVLLLVFSLRV